jgi:REP element-mobilizing transposase RayT
MNDPIAFFLTISTYGTWLPGDARGWVEYHQGWKMPDPVRELEAKAIMREDACILSLAERSIVEKQLDETCRFRGWTLHARTCRSNHMHALVSVKDVGPKKIREDLKAWCTRRLREQSDAIREHWWAERGSIRWVLDDSGVEAVTLYIEIAQARMGLDRHEMHSSPVTAPQTRSGPR